MNGNVTMLSPETYKRLILFVFLLCFELFSKNIWVAQTARGSNNGADSTNAHSIAWLNTANNWGTDAADISPGDKVLFCGICTTAVTIQASGTASKITTFTFAPGAKFSKPAWPSSGAINANGKSYFIIDGGNVGTAVASGEAAWHVNVEATDNGTLFQNKLSPRSVYVRSATDVIIRNMKVMDGYVRDSGSTDGIDGGTGIMLTGTKNLTIKNNYVEWFENGVYMKGEGVNVEGLLVDSNCIYNISNGILFACAGPNNTILGGHITHNRLNKFACWEAGGHHNDGIQSMTSQAGNKITGLHVAYNYIGPDAGKFGDTNAWIFLEDNMNHSYVYNNVLTCLPGHRLTNGFINAGRNERYWNKGDTNGLIANNTILGSGKNTGITGAHMDIFGNIVTNVSTYIAVNNLTQNQVDFNVYYDDAAPNAEWWMVEDGIIKTFFAWQEKGMEPNSANENPKMKEVYLLEETSPFVKYVPEQTLFTDDFDGYSRPKGGLWSAGASQYYFVPKPYNIALGKP